MVNMFRDFRQIRQFQGSTILLNNVHQRNIVEHQFIVLDIELPCWELKRLVNQVIVCLHPYVRRIKWV